MAPRNPRGRRRFPGRFRTAAVAADTGAVKVAATEAGDGGRSKLHVSTGAAAIAPRAPQASM